MTSSSDSSSALATLCSIFPSHAPAQLERTLTAARGDLERATTALLEGRTIVSSASEGRGDTKRRRVEGKGLDRWLKGLKRDEPEPKPKPKPKPNPPPPSHRSSTTTTGKSAFDLLLRPPPPPPAPSAPAPAAAINLPPLLLSSPAMVTQHTNGLCTLIYNVLPSELAGRLFEEMLRESEGWERNKWFLFDREVESPHTTSFYVEPASSSSSEAADEAATHWYNGRRHPARYFLPSMNEARELVGELVRTVLHSRSRHPLEWPLAWSPNVAAANCYRGAQESVGWHSDALTYLGPYPTIASLSLGVGRAFRLRPFLPSASTGTIQTLEIYLPHNSLLIMHAGCQERYKHAVPPKTGGGMDLWKDGGGRKWRERINITFRHYRPDFAPLPSASSSSRTTTEPSSSASAAIKPQAEGGGSRGRYKGTPHCSCGVPAILRPDARHRARTAAASSRQNEREEQEEEEELWFFWSCAAGMQNQGRKCGFWKRLEMEREGRGEWFLLPSAVSAPLSSDV